MRTSVLGLCALVTMLGCGTSAQATNDPAVIGTWFAQVTPVSTDNQTETLVFKGDKTFTAVHTQVDQATSTTPGCTETINDSGTFTTSGTTLTFNSDTTKSGQIVRSGCTNASDNMLLSGSPFVSGPVTYSVTGGSLSISGGGASAPIVFAKK